LAGNNLIAEEQDAFWQSGYGRLKLFDSIDDDRPGSAALHGCLGYSVDVRVVPVEPRWLIPREGHAVVESLPGIDDRVDHLVPVTLGGHVLSVEVEIERTDRYR
jgi:hypothetical protein